MARKEDLERVEQDMKAVAADGQNIQKTYQTYAQKVNAKISAILKKAGVFDQVHELEEQRSGTQQKAQAKLNAAQKKLQELGLVRDYLLGLGPDPTTMAASADEEIPVEETPEPTDETPASEVAEDEEIVPPEFS